MYSWGTETPSKCLPYLYGFGIRRLFFLSEEFRELEENSLRMKIAHLKGMRRVYLLELGLKLLDLVLAVKILNRLPSILLLSFKAWSNNCVNMLSFGFSWVSASVYKI